MLRPANRSAAEAAWHFFKGNYALNFGALAIFVLLSLLSSIPLIGLLFFAAYTILSFSAQIYFGRKVVEVDEPAQMEQVAQKTRLGDFLTTYLPQATGGFLAFFAISMLFGILFAFSMDPVSFAGGAAVSGAEGMAQAMAKQLLSSLSPFSLFLLLLMAFLLYIFPAVAGRIVFSEDFGQAFRAGFLLFSPSMWKKTFRQDYFMLVAGWSLVVFGFLIISSILSSSIILLPVALVLAYILSLYNAAIYVFAQSLAK